MRLLDADSLISRIENHAEAMYILDDKTREIYRLAHFHIIDLVELEVEKFNEIVRVVGDWK